MPERADRNRSRQPAAPPERALSVRAAISDALTDAELTAREISAQVGVAERDVAGHLEHLAQSLPHSGRTLVVTPPRCIACGFRFESRTRRSRPSRCPSCRSERIDPARFAIGTGSRPAVKS